MAQIRTLVVGVSAMQDDDPKLAPPGEDPVLEPAVELARNLGATLHVVHVLDGPDPVLSAYTHAVHGESSAYRQQVEKRLEEQVRRFTEHGDLVCEALEGSPASELCEYAEGVGADLLLVGASRRGRLWHNILGSTAQQTLGCSRVPVLVIRQPWSHEVRRVLFTTDLSEFSAGVHETGRELIMALFGPGEVKLRSLFAHEYDGLLSHPSSGELLAQVAGEKLEEFLRRLEPGTLAMEGKTRLGTPSTEVPREVSEWRADLLVLGTQARRSYLPLRLGSTAAAILRTTSCNALVIPPAPALRLP